MSVNYSKLLGSVSKERRTSEPFVLQEAPHDEPEFDEMLRAQLEALSSPEQPFFYGDPVHLPSIAQQGVFGDSFGHVDAFNLPLELQGGIGTISSRRPSYAAELFTRSQPFTAAHQKKNLAQLAAANNYTLNLGNMPLDGLNEQFQHFSLGAGLPDYARRPLLGPPLPTHFQKGFQKSAPKNPPMASAPGYAFAPLLPFNLAPSAAMKLDNSLLLRDQYIMALEELKALFRSVSCYFQDTELSAEIMQKLKQLLTHEVVQRLVTFIKNLNSLSFNQRLLCLVVNKNGKLDLLLYPSNSNIYLQHDDLVIVDGDRGKDLVMILEPHVDVDLAILFNFLKKIEHLKSLTINDANGGSSVKGNHLGGTHSTGMKAADIAKNRLSEDNEFLITLPTKQVLRLATPKEVQKLSTKFLEEERAFITCFNKIKELGLHNGLTLINVEYQCDFKKLIFYYFANFKRVDFRGLIKELFKIFKTRIWLCAVLPHDMPELYTGSKPVNALARDLVATIPNEYSVKGKSTGLTIADFAKLPKPTYFHLRNMLHLINNVTNELQGPFYGFNVAEPAGSIFDSPTKAGSPRRAPIHPSFNPFGDDQKRL